jgi:hypothetical protein
MKVGDLVRVSDPYCIPFLAIVVTFSWTGAALVRSLRWDRDTWAYGWFVEVVNEGRRRNKTSKRM